MTVITRRPEEILEYHADTTRRYKAPGPMIGDYLRNFMQDCCHRGSGSSSLSMFFPALPADINPRAIHSGHGTAYARLLGADLAEAVTYVVTAEMTDVMRAVNVDDTRRIEQAELPCEAGFAWFDDGWPLHDTNGDIYVMRAVSWRFLTVPSKGTFGQLRDWPCARFTLWVHTSDDTKAVLSAAHPIVHAQLGDLQIIHTGLVPLGMEVGRAEGDQGDNYLNLVHLLWMFLAMEITATARPRIKNHYRRQALKSLVHGEVHVVLLRRTRHGGEPITALGHADAPVDWSCRWVVQGHYRHHVAPANHHHAIPVGPDKHCAACDGELAWVRPYIKGPDGKPLKVSHTIMRLAR